MVGLDPRMERNSLTQWSSVTNTTVTTDDYDVGKREEALWVLMGGRVLLGVGIGISSITVPIYIAEVGRMRVKRVNPDVHLGRAVAISETIRIDPLTQRTAMI